MSTLTIAIPTYNRVEYLEKCLKSLALNKINYDDVEILVIDNSSPDNTIDIVKQYEILLNLKYIKNTTNIGADENFKKCIKESKSKYVWIFGDDDIFFENSIEFILSILQSHNNIGVLHLSAENFMDENLLMNSKNRVYDYDIFESKEDFVKKIHTNITFISANIINKKLILDNVDLDDIPNNNLGQVYWSLLAILKGNKNIFVSKKIFAARQFNSGNYDFCQVFGKNFISTIELVNKDFNTEKIIYILKKRLAMIYLPANIVRLRNNMSAVKYSGCFKTLFPIYKTNPFFWIFTIPAMILPKKMALFFYRIVDKVRKSEKI